MPSATLDARFAAIIDLLHRAVAARIAGGALAGPLIILICGRLRRMARRFASLAARHVAGRLHIRRRAPSPRPARRRSGPPGWYPRGHAWLVRLVPAAAGGGSQLQYLLAEPEMADFLAAAPQAGRILRPLCRALGIRPPETLRLKPPARRTPASPPPAASPSDPPPAPALAPGACGPPICAA